MGDTQETRAVKLYNNQQENNKKLAQLQEAGVDSSTLRALQFHQSQIYDPEFTEKELQMRDVYPDYYLHPNDEFVYQLVRGRAREEKVREQVHAEAVEFLREWQKAEGGKSKK